MAAVLDTVAVGAMAMSRDLPDLISSIGEDSFELELITYLHRICGAEHCTVFQFGDDDPRRFASVSLDGTDTASRQARIYLDRQCWLRDPAFLEARRRMGNATPSLLRVDVRKIPDPELRDVVYGRTRIRDRLLLCGVSAGTALGISILRSERRGAFAEEEIQRLDAAAGMLLSLVAKHAGSRWQRSNLASALTSLAEIERCLLRAPQPFPRREAEVCARVLYGMTSLGIALDLGIGEETVMTYRKRVYQRLKLSSNRDLLLWYLALWSGRAGQMPGESQRGPVALDA